MNDKENLYFKQRDGSLYTKKTKEQIRLMVDPKDPNTFLPILEDMNYPYFIHEWNKIVEKSPTKAGIIGRYIAFMNLKGYADFTWKDSILYNAIANAKRYQKEK